MKEIGLRDLRPRLAPTMRIVEGGEPVVVTRQGREVAVLVPVDRYDRLLLAEKEYNELTPEDLEYE